MAVVSRGILPSSREVKWRDGDSWCLVWAKKGAGEKEKEEEEESKKHGARRGPVALSVQPGGNEVNAPGEKSEERSEKRERRPFASLSRLVNALAFSLA